MKQRFKSGADTGKAASTDNMNTSFSAMNTSLSAKWNEINKKSAATKREGGTTPAHMSNTMQGFSGPAIESRTANTGQMNASIGSNPTPEGSQGGATNQDLTKKLAEMKAKLQALKKK